nr:hypothetical protein B0A51_15275 [Rachicladosporium sp. CCFEE 5018]
MSAPPASEQSRSSPQNESALADLERLQDQVDSLRSLLPSLIAPLTRAQSSKVQTFAELKKAAVSATTDLQTLRQTWTSERTQEVFAKAKESESSNDDLSREAEVTQYGWIERTASNGSSASVTT